MSQNAPAPARNRRGRRLVPLSAATGAGLLLACVAVSPASAHFSVTPSSTAAGSYTVLTFAFGHGCDGSPTESFTIEIPEGIYAVAPEVQEGWTIEKVMEDLDEPVDDGYGGEYTERVAQVIYTADTPVEDGYYFTTDFSLKLPDEEAGTVVEFPTVQTCTEGENDWIESTDPDGEEPDSPAPYVTLTAAEDDEHSHSSTDSSTESTTEASDDTDSDTGATSALGWVGAGAGVLGLIVGGVALGRTRSKA